MSLTGPDFIAKPDKQFFVAARLRFSRLPALTLLRTSSVSLWVSSTSEITSKLEFSDIAQRKMSNNLPTEPRHSSDFLLSIGVIIWFSYDDGTANVDTEDGVLVTFFIRGVRNDDLRPSEFIFCVSLVSINVVQLFFNADYISNSAFILERA